MQRHRLLIFVIVLTCAVAVPSLAHHSLAGYDQTTLVLIKGTITKVEWVNPHVWVTLNVRNADGSSSTSRIEIAAPTALMKTGLTRDMLNIGDNVTFEAWLPKSTGADSIPNGRTLMLGDGRSFDVGDLFGNIPR
jgi:hypothetical protein